MNYKEILKDSKEICCLGITKDGFPKHPLYLKGTTMPKACEFDGIKIKFKIRSELNA